MCDSEIEVLYIEIKKENIYVRHNNGRIYKLHKTHDQITTKTIIIKDFKSCVVQVAQ